MAIKGFMESNLATSEIFNGLNSMSGKNQTDMAIKLAKTAKRLSNEDIEAAYIQVKQYPDSLTREAVKAWDARQIELIYNDVSTLSVTQALPFITFKMGPNKFTTFVFMDKHIKKSREGILSCQAPVLQDLLIGALIANRLKSNYERLASNQFLQKLLMELYVKFVTHIINREYQIKADRIVFDTIQYHVGRFFLTRIFGTNDLGSNIEILAKKDLRYIDELRLSEIQKKYNDADPMNVSELLALLSTVSPRMKELSLHTFVSNWINYYYPPAMLAIDNIEYLIFMVLCLLRGNNIISIAASDVVKEAKNIKTLREELLKLI